MDIRGLFGPMTKIGLTRSRNHMHKYQQISGVYALVVGYRMSDSMPAHGGRSIFLSRSFCQGCFRMAFMPSDIREVYLVGARVKLPYILRNLRAILFLIGSINGDSRYFHILLFKHVFMAVLKLLRMFSCCAASSLP